jgi:hypothetical protein
MSVHPEITLSEGGTPGSPTIEVSITRPAVTGSVKYIVWYKLAGAAYAVHSTTFAESVSISVATPGNYYVKVQARTVSFVGGKPTTTTTPFSEAPEASIRIIGVVVSYRGDYDAGTTYSYGDMVLYDGSSYVYVNATPAAGKTPPDNMTTYWMMFVGSGDLGLLTVHYPILSGITWTESYPVAAWTEGTVTYDGDDYTVVADDTTYRFIYWDPADPLVFGANDTGAPAGTYLVAYHDIVRQRVIEMTTQMIYDGSRINVIDYTDIPRIQGAYAAGTVYSKGQVVTYAGSSYIFINNVPSAGKTPPENLATYWLILSSKGDTGATGATGATGPQGETGEGVPGPGVVYRGPFNAATAYYYVESVRRDIVTYSGSYWLYKGANGASGAWDSGNWDSFGATFESVATKLLLAEDATILYTLTFGDGVSAGLIQTAAAPGKRIVIDGNTNTIKFYDASNNLVFTLDDTANGYMNIGVTGSNVWIGDGFITMATASGYSVLINSQQTTGDIFTVTGNPTGIVQEKVLNVKGNAVEVGQGNTKMDLTIPKGDLNLTVPVGGGIYMEATKVLGKRVVDARIDDTINTSSWDSTTAGVLDAIRDALITHGLIAAS